MRPLRWFVGFLLAIAILLVAGVLAVAYLPQLNGARQTFAADALSDTFDREVKIEGPVTVSLGSTVDVSIRDMRFISVFSRSPGEPEHIDHGTFSMPLAGLLRGETKITRLDLSGAKVELESSAEGVASHEQKIAALAGFPTRFLNLPLSGDLTLNDVTLHFVNPDAGFDELVSIDNLRSIEGLDGATIEVSAKGTVNGLPLGLDASFENPRQKSEPSPGDFELELALPGLTNHLSGTLDLREPVAVVDGKLDVRIESLGDSLDALQLRRVIEGTGDLTARLSGPLDALVAQDIDGSASSEEGNDVVVKGRIDALSTGEGLNLTVSGKLAALDSDPADATSSATQLSDLRVTGFDGHLSGGFDAMQVDRFIVRTNSLNVNFRNIGPISVARIAKDEEGKLSIRGIRVLDGPADRRTLDLEGDIDDALKLRGARFAGAFDLATTDVLFLKGSEDAGALGRFKGKLAISDEDGSFGLDTFEGSVEGSDLVKLKLERVAKDANSTDKTAFRTDLDIPDFAAFAAALGVKSEAKGGLQFDGSLAVSNDLSQFEGRITANETTIEGKLSAERVDGVPRITGSVESDSLAVADLRNLWGLKSFDRKENVDYVTFNENLLEKLQIDVEVDAREIAEAGKDAGNFTGRIAYGDGSLRFDPLALTYLGGKIEAAVTVDTTKKTPILLATGSVSQIPLENLLDQLRAPKKASGSLNAKFDVSGVASRSEFANTVSGNATLSLWGGSIGTNMIDLTAMDYVSWAFNQKDDDSTPIVCAVLPLSLKNGRGTTSMLVVETENVQLIGEGSVDLGNKTMDLTFRPIPKNEDTAGVATPFTVSGPLAKPDIDVDQQAVNQRMGKEMMAMPLKLFNSLMGSNEPDDAAPKGKPCVVQKTAMQEDAD